MFSAQLTLSATALRDDGTPLNYTLVNIADCCESTFQVASQLPIIADYSRHRYDVILLVNGVPCALIELEALGITQPGRSSRSASTRMIRTGALFQSRGNSFYEHR